MYAVKKIVFFDNDAPPTDHRPSIQSVQMAKTMPKSHSHKVIQPVRVSSISIFSPQINKIGNEDLVGVDQRLDALNMDRSMTSFDNHGPVIQPLKLGQKQLHLFKKNLKIERNNFKLMRKKPKLLEEDDIGDLHNDWVKQCQEKDDELMKCFMNENTGPKFDCRKLIVKQSYDQITIEEMDKLIKRKESKKRIKKIKIQQPNFKPMRDHFMKTANVNSRGKLFGQPKEQVKAENQSYDKAVNLPAAEAKPHPKLVISSAASISPVFELSRPSCSNTNVNETPNIKDKGRITKFRFRKVQLNNPYQIKLHENREHFRQLSNSKSPKGKSRPSTQDILTR